MKKYLIYIFIAIIVVSIISAIIFNFNKNNNQNDSNQNPSVGQRTSVNINEEQAENRINSIIENPNNIMQASSKETEISAFSTNLLDDTPARVNNISITCSTLNGTIVKTGDTFSFNNVIGKPTVERGYQEAKVIIDHEAELGIGRWKLPSK